MTFPPRKFPARPFGAKSAFSAQHPRGSSLARRRCSGSARNDRGMVHYAGCNEVRGMDQSGEADQIMAAEEKDRSHRKDQSAVEDLAQNWGREMKLKGESIEEIP
jgi:hypothetical protein